MIDIKWAKAWPEWSCRTFLSCQRACSFFNSCSIAVILLSLLTALSTSSSLIAFTAMQNDVHVVKSPLTSFFIVSGMPLHTKWRDAHEGSCASADSTKILLAHQACPVISTPLTMTITPMSSFTKFLFLSLTLLCSMVMATMTSSGHCNLNAALSRSQSFLVFGRSASNYISATELVTNLFLTLKAWGIILECATDWLQEVPRHWVIRVMVTPKKRVCWHVVVR